MKDQPLTDTEIRVLLRASEHALTSKLFDAEGRPDLRSALVRAKAKLDKALGPGSAEEKPK